MSTSDIHSAVEKVLADYDYLHDQDCHTRYGGGMSCSCWQGPLREALAAQPPATDRDAQLTGRPTLTDVIVTKMIEEYGEDDATWRDLRSAQRIAQAARAHIESEPRIARALAARPAPDTLADRVQALAERYEQERERCLEWYRDPSKHADEGHPDRLLRLADMLHRHATDLRALLAGRSEPTLAERVQANPVLLDALRYHEERRTMNNPKGWGHVHRAVSRSRAAYPSATDEQYAEALAVLALLAGRSDASPEGGEQRE